MDISDDQGAADVFDFIDEYLSDREQGREHGLAHYLTRFPRHPEEIAREYLALRSRSSASGIGDAAKPRDASSTVARSDEPGAQRIGPYRLMQEIGRGGQGSVFLAEDTRIARRVALKILTSRFDMVSEDRLKRFRREAEVIARLEHPNICGIYDADIDSHTPWIAMRLVEGQTLAAILNDARERASSSSGTLKDVRASGAARATAAPQSGSDARREHESDLTSTWPPSTPLDVHRVLLLFERSARALHAAHEAGVVHRDVKPGNIIVTAEGKPVLLDFGLARDEHSEVSALTQSGDVFGTPAYMSPEQLNGSSDALDRRTDVYSLGVSLYESLTLVRPFDAPNRMALYVAIQSEPPPDPRSKNKRLSEDVKVVLETALDKNRERRYRTALDFAEDLRRIREYEPVRARPVSVGLRFARWTRRHPTLAVFVIGTILALSGGLALSLVMLAREQKALEDKRVAVAEQEKALEEKRVAVAEQEKALQSALGRHLAERSNALISEDPSASLAVAIDAVKRAPNYLTRSALFTALDACYLERMLAIPDGDPARRITDVALSPDGSRAAAGMDDGTTRVFELASGSILATYTGAATNAGEKSEISAVRWSADGRWIADASNTGVLTIRDAATGGVIHTARAEHPLIQIELDADEKHLLALSSAGHATIWDTGSWRAEAELDQGAGGIARACFAPDGRVLTIARAESKARTATVWDARSGRPLRELGGDGDVLLWCDVSQDARRPRALTASKDGRVRVFDLADGAKTATLEHDAPVVFARFSPNGSQVFTATEVRPEEGSARLWNLSTGESVVLGGHGDRKVTHAAFAPDGARLATASVDLSVRIWRTSDGREERQYRALLRPVSLHWTRDGRHLISRANALVAHVWSTQNHPDVLTIKAHEKRVNSTSFSPDGTQVLTASDDGSARVWFAGGATAAPGANGASARAVEGTARSSDADARNSANGVAHSSDASVHNMPASNGSRADNSNAEARRAREPGALMLVLQHAGSVAGASFSPDGEKILTVSADHTARLWSARTGKPVRGALQHPDAVRSGSWNVDGTRVLTISADGSARIFGLQESAPVVLCTKASARVACAAFDPAGALVAVGADDDVLRLFDAASGELVAELAFTHKPLASGGIDDVAFCPGADEVAAACGDNTVRFWNTATKKPSRADIHVSTPRGLSFSGDGARLLVIGRWGGGAIWVKDLRTNQSLRHPELRHTDDITAGSFSRDGRHVLTASKDSTSLVWDAENAQPITARNGHGSPITCAEFSTDAGERRVITGSDDGTVSIWPVDPLPAAERRKPRDLHGWEKAREARLARPLTYD